MARGTDCAKLIVVIETQALKGEGTKENPSYIAIQYWDLEGNFLAEKILTDIDGNVVNPTK